MKTANVVWIMVAIFFIALEGILLYLNLKPDRAWLGITEYVTGIIWAIVIGLRFKK